MYEFLNNFFQGLSSIVWGPVAWALLLLAGIILSFKVNWLQVTKFGHYMNHTIIDVFRKPENRKSGKPTGDGDITPWQAVSTALSATLGVGTIAGTATAIGFGGPGAIFWMWAVGFFGIATKFSEVTLAVHFRGKNQKGEMLSGPFAYIEKGLGIKWLAIIFAIFGTLASFGIGNMVQSNSAATALETVFGWDRVIVGIIASILIGVVVVGGIKRIAKVVDKVIPTMAATVIISATIIILLNITSVPYAFGLIFRSAFSAQSLGGGVAGVAVFYAVRFGLMRGVFSNEAGLGSGPIAYAAAKTDDPVKQGFWAAFEVFLDTHVLCTLIALVILINVPLEAIAPGTSPYLTGPALVIESYARSFLGVNIGSWLMAIVIAVFGFSTVLGWSYYGEKCFEYLFGLKYVIIFRILIIPFIFFGAIGGLALVWSIADNFNAFMAFPNILAVLLLSGTVASLTKRYFKGEKYDPEKELKTKQ